LETVSVSGRRRGRRSWRLWTAISSSTFSGPRFGRWKPRCGRCTVSQFCEALEAEGIPAEANKITGGMATYLYDIFQHRSAFPESEFPFVSGDLDSNISYPKGMCPRAELAFEQTFNLNVSEFYSTADIDDMIRAVQKVAGYYRAKYV
jgi:hypothetical protein